MATTTTTPTSGSLTTEKVTYRSYVKLKDDGTIDKIVSKAQVKDNANWNELEKNGWIQFAQNDFLRYTVKDLAAAQLLIPDEAQLVYVIQAGLNYVQNAKSNAYMVEVKEGTNTPQVAPVPETNDEEVDLREAINETPSRRSLSPMEKVEKTLAAFSPEIRAQLLAALMAQNAAASQVEEEEQPA